MEDPSIMRRTRKTDAEKREAARQFYQRWTGRGREDEDARSYWIEFLQNIMGMEHVTERVDFEKKVIGPDGNTKRIDAYIPETKVLIEQKATIEKTAATIIEVRKKFLNDTLAEMYDPLTMPSELQKAYAENDRAVMNAYGFNIKEMSEADCVAALMKMYQEYVGKAQ